GGVLEGHVLRPAAPGETAAHARAGDVPTSPGDRPPRTDRDRGGGELDMNQPIDLLVRNADPVSDDAIEGWRRSKVAATIRARTLSAVAEAPLEVLATGRRRRRRGPSIALVAAVLVVLGAGGGAAAIPPGPPAPPDRR